MLAKADLVSEEVYKLHEYDFTLRLRHSILVTALLEAVLLSTAFLSLLALLHC